MASITSNKPRKSQLEVLELLYKFRFGTTDLLARALGLKDGRYIHTRLDNLCQQEYIGRNYDNSYKLHGKPASYYLLPNAFAVLKNQKGINQTTIKNMYKDKNASEQFVEYSLGMFDIYCRFKGSLGDSLHFFTKSQLTNKYDYFSEFVPSAYVRIGEGTREKDYFLEYLQSTKPFFANAKRIREHIEYADSGEWEEATNSPFPEILLIADTPKLQKRLLEKSNSILADADDELRVFTTTKASDIWFDLAEPYLVLPTCYSKWEVTYLPVANRFEPAGYLPLDRK